MNDLDKTQISSWIETYQELNEEQLHTVLKSKLYKESKTFKP